MKPIIRVEKLSKQYQIGAQRNQISTFRESITSAMRAPLKWLQRSEDAVENKIWALKDVSFNVVPGEVVGVIGRNGAGKSTLLKLLSRITEPTIGQIDLYGRIGSLLEVGTGFHQELSGRENVYLNGAILGMHRGEINSKFDEIVEFSEIGKFIDTPVKHYSSGMFMRLAFAVAAFLDSDILVVDEVLAVGDDAFQKKCLNKMDSSAKSGKTVLFVSHNMSMIANLCTSCLLFDKGKLIFSGGIKESIEIYLQEGQESEKEFPGEVVKWAGIRQVDDRIEISVVYDFGDTSFVPCLGFVISDYFGNPVCGNNNILDEPPIPATSKFRGEIKVVIRQPKLLDGIYRLSLWLGNGREDLFSARDCLFFEVVNMASKKKQFPNNIVGSAAPECEWIFD